MKRIFKWVGIGVGAVVVLFLLLMLQPWVFLPHKHIVISLPFAPSDDTTTGIIPMGEKIEHNESNGNPNGHPGIDFRFSKVTNVLAVADGRITDARFKENLYDVTVSSGYYKVTYKELNAVEPGIHKFGSVKQGKVIGQSGVENAGVDKPKQGDPSRQIHWEFSSASMLVDRLCPLNYFDADARARIEAIWNAMPKNDRFKSDYPDICSGYYKDKEG